MSDRLDRFPAVCTNDEARSYFREKGLSYDSINEGDILVLVMMCQQERKTNGAIVSCFLYMNSHYFTRREAISFNQNGFIGFAGWADQGNVNPLLRAFLRWCDWVEEVANYKKPAQHKSD